MAFEKPRIVYSACLNLEPVRYNGYDVKDEFALKLRNFVEIISVCPEVSIGLGVPRDRLLVYKESDRYFLFQPSTRIDLTEKMLDFSQRFLNNIDEVDGFLLKSKSPSCGISNVNVYKDKDGKVFLTKSKGLFASEVLKNFPDLPIEDEGRLKNEDIRRHFLIRIFAHADLRAFLKTKRDKKELIEFHKKYKYLLMLYSPGNLKKLGNLVAESKDVNKMLPEYKAFFIKSLAKKPTKGRYVNVILHILGHISENLKQREKEHFLKLLEDYKNDKVNLKVILEILRNWAYRFDNEYLLAQAFLNPYPDALD